MTGSTRYLRYIVFAFVALIVIFFISSSSQQVPDYETAKSMFKGQGWSQTSPDTPAEPVVAVDPIDPAATDSNHGTSQSGYSI